MIRGEKKDLDECETGQNNGVEKLQHNAFRYNTVETAYSDHVGAVPISSL